MGLAFACWPDRPPSASRSAWRGLLVYNALIAVYLAVVGSVGGPKGVLLWPVVAIHAAVAILLPGWDERRPETRGTRGHPTDMASPSALLVAISGIDGAGKGYVAAKLQSRLERHGLRAALVGADGWLNLPAVRFSPTDPAAHFYRHAIRFEEMFERLVLPLRDRRSIRLEADFAEETATMYRKHVYEWNDVDVVLLEGIYLLRRDLRRHYDLAVWVDCSFETALTRAMARAQEGLTPEETAEAYRRIYFPAQEIHLRTDDPRGSADYVFRNDSETSWPSPASEERCPRTLAERS